MGLRGWADCLRAGWRLELRESGKTQFARSSLERGMDSDSGVKLKC